MVMVVGYLKNGCPDIILYRIGLYYHWLYLVSFRINALLSLNTILNNINTTTVKSCTTAAPLRAHIIIF